MQGPCGSSLARPSSAVKRKHHDVWELSQLAAVTLHDDLPQPAVATAAQAGGSSRERKQVAAGVMAEVQPSRSNECRGKTSGAPAQQGMAAPTQQGGSKTTAAVGGIEQGSDNKASAQTATPPQDIRRSKRLAAAAEDEQPEEGRGSGGGAPSEDSGSHGTTARDAAGMGVMVASDLALTACHVLRRAAKGSRLIGVRRDAQRRKSTMQLKAIYVHKPRDLAVLKVLTSSTEGEGEQQQLFGTSRCSRRRQHVTGMTSTVVMFHC